jgi:exodeoxyribonuclease VII large subunit
MAKALQRRANIDRQRLDLLAAHPIFQRPHDRIESLRNQLDEMNSRICRSQEFLFRDLNQKLTGLSKRLETISPLQVLARGYSITQDENGKTITDSIQVLPGQRISTRLANGSIESTVDNTEQ